MFRVKSSTALHMTLQSKNSILMIAVVTYRHSTYSGSLGTKAGSFFGISVMSTSVVRTSAAIEAAFSIALIVTYIVLCIMLCYVMLLFVMLYFLFLFLVSFCRVLSCIAYEAHEV